MFVGRGYTIPTALEGALKLKEISYVHAEGYAAGELKHGPISLLDAEYPLVAVATRSPVYDKLISNVMEGRARDARVHRGRDRGRRADRALRRRRLLGARHARGAEPGPRRSSRSSCSPTTWRSPAARTSTSRATSPSRSRSSRARAGIGGPRRSRSLAALAIPLVAAAITELGIDIIKVDRIRASIERFGERFSKRVLTPGEQRYVRMRPETFAGRWAAKEAVSKVLGLGVRGIGWRDIEIERLPTGQPSVRLHGRAAARARPARDGPDRASRSRHESDYAVAIAFGVRTRGGRYVFPLDIEERLDDRERRLLARMERLRAPAERRARTPGAAARPTGDGEWLTASGRLRAGRRRTRAARTATGTRRPRAPSSTTPIAPASSRSGDKRGHKGSFGKLLVLAGSLDYAGAALLVCRAAGRAGAGLVTLAVPGVAPAAVRREGRRGDDDGPARGRRRGGRPGAGARPDPRPRSRRDRRRARAAARASRPPSSSGAALAARRRRQPRADRPRRRGAPLARDAGALVGRATAGRAS